MRDGGKGGSRAKPDLAATWQTQLDAARPGGRNEREKDTRLTIQFPSPDAALGAGGRRSAAIPTGQKPARKGRVRAFVLTAFLAPAERGCVHWRALTHPAGANSYFSVWH